MNYKVEGAVRRNKRNFIIFIILWVVLTIVFIMPISYALVNSSVMGVNFFEGLYNSFSHLGKVIQITFTSAYFGGFLGILWKWTLLYFAFVLIGLIRTAPKNEFSDIEHGSSDWCKNGEQYRVLSNKSGIILAQDNYLPVDKRGNVNVLVVGRIRIW